MVKAHGSGFSSVYTLSEPCSQKAENKQSPCLERGVGSNPTLVILISISSVFNFFIFSLLSSL